MLSSRRATRSSCTTDVLPALEQLRTRYRLFTASNGNADLGQDRHRAFLRAQRRRAAGRRAEAGSGDLPQGDRRHRPAASTRSCTSATIRSSTSRARAAPACRPIWINRDRAAVAGGDRAAAHTVALADRAGRAAGAVVTVGSRLQAVRLMTSAIPVQCACGQLPCHYRIGVHSAPFVVPLPAFFSGLASRVIEDPLFRPTSEKSDETANVGLGPQPCAAVRSTQAAGRSPFVTRPRSGDSSIGRSRSRLFQRETCIVMTKIYVGNLPFSADETQVRQLFEQHGTVESVALINDRETGRPRGFGFVEMPRADAQRAIQSLNGKDMGGRPLRVNEAQERQGGGGGGGGGRGPRGRWRWRWRWRRSLVSAHASPEANESPAVRKCRGVSLLQQWHS